MKMNELKDLANKELIGWHYKIILCLINEELTTTDIANRFNRKPQNISKCIKELEDMELIEVSRIHGKNKFYKLKC